MTAGRGGPWGEGGPWGAAGGGRRGGQGASWGLGREEFRRRNEGHKISRTSGRTKELSERHEDLIVVIGILEEPFEITGISLNKMSS